MKRTVAVAIICSVLSVMAYAQTVKWHWWMVGYDQISPNRVVATYSTGKEVIVCNEVYGELDGYAHGNIPATSCVLVK